MEEAGEEVDEVDEEVGGMVAVLEVAVLEVAVCLLGDGRFLQGLLF